MDNWSRAVKAFQVNFMIGCSFIVFSNVTEDSRYYFKGNAKVISLFNHFGIRVYDG